MRIKLLWDSDLNPYDPDEDAHLHNVLEDIKEAVNPETKACYLSTLIRTHAASINLPYGSAKDYYTIGDWIQLQKDGIVSCSYWWEN